MTTKEELLDQLRARGLAPQPSPTWKATYQTLQLRARSLGIPYIHQTLAGQRLPVGPPHHLACRCVIVLEDPVPVPMKARLSASYDVTLNRSRVFLREVTSLDDAVVAIDRAEEQRPAWAYFVDWQHIQTKHTGGVWSFIPDRERLAAHRLLRPVEAWEYRGGLPTWAWVLEGQNGLGTHWGPTGEPFAVAIRKALPR
jgi:hypothetical protein